ncbi:hypothetical protein L2E82_25694 [Cichorium intybus]|uniref:Uncharacterized protein n=1 Tax=Cichorium intybus TaxID=13427 RepID=A0ACB9E4N4_CICIN|nr:hypothetical protein L2E82_25694 [Cichorium intybus]
MRNLVWICLNSNQVLDLSCDFEYCNYVQHFNLIKFRFLQYDHIYTKEHPHHWGSWLHRLSCRQSPYQKLSRLQDRRSRQT